MVNMIKTFHIAIIASFTLHLTAFSAIEYQQWKEGSNKITQIKYIKLKDKYPEKKKYIIKKKITKIEKELLKKEIKKT